MRFQAQLALRGNVVGFKIDRSQRIHHSGLVVRVYQVVGTTRFGWDTNRDRQPMPDQENYESLAAAEHAADAGVQLAGHTCTKWCYAWRLL